MKKKLFTLGRNEIIRGFRSIENVLTGSTRLEKGNIVSYVKLSEDSTGFPVTVGFLISKKKLKILMTATA